MTAIRRTLLLLVLVSVLSSVFFAPSIVHADPAADAAAAGSGQTRGSCGIGANIGMFGYSLGDGTLLACLDYAVAYLAYWMLSLMAFFLGIAGILLDTVIQLTVVEMSRYFNAGPDSAVSVAWSTFRDLANISLIFVLLTLGIAKILQVESYSNNRLLAKVLIVAVLLNFSIFFCKAALDLTNIIALQFYDAIQTSSTVGNDPASFGRGDISGIIMTKLGLTSLYNTGAQGVTGGSSGSQTFLRETDRLSTSAVIFIGFAGTVLFIIAMFVLGAAALMLIARLIVLIFLTALSPLAFVAMILPGTRRYWEKWFDIFTKNALYAPIFMMMLWVSLHVINGMQSLTTLSGATGASFYQLWLDPTRIGELFMHFAMMAGLLVGSLMIAREMGAYGSAGALKGLDSVRRWGQGYVGRNTVGWASRGALDAYNKTGLARGLSRIPILNTVDLGVKQGLEKGSKATFGSKTSYDSRRTELEGRQKELASIQRETKTATDVKKAKDDQQMQEALSKMSNKEIEKLDDILTSNELLVKNLSPQQLESLMKSDALTEQKKEKIRSIRFDSLNKALALQPGAARTAEIAKEAKKLSAKEVEMLPASVLKNREFVESLSDSTYDDVVKSNSVVKAVKDDMKVQRLARLKEAAEKLTKDPTDGEALKTVQAELKKRKSSDVAKLDKTILENEQVALQLSSSDLSAMVREADQDTRDKVRQHWEKFGREMDALSATLGAPPPLKREQGKALAWLRDPNKPGSDLF